MDLNALTAISPVDGRYRKTTEPLDIYFSEYGLIKYRVQVEVEYFIALADIGLPQLPKLDENKKKLLKNIYLNFTVEDALVIKETEIVKHYFKSKFK